MEKMQRDDADAASPATSVASMREKLDAVDAIAAGLNPSAQAVCVTSSQEVLKRNCTIIEALNADPNGPKAAALKHELNANLLQVVRSYQDMEPTTVGGIADAPRK